MGLVRCQPHSQLHLRNAAARIVAAISLGSSGKLALRTSFDLYHGVTGGELTVVAVRRTGF